MTQRLVDQGHGEEAYEWLKHAEAEHLADNVLNRQCTRFLFMLIHDCHFQLGTDEDAR